MQFTRWSLLLRMRCGAMTLPPRQNVNVRLLIHACLPSISSLRAYALPIFVTVSSLYHPFRFVPYQWGSFFNTFCPFQFEYPSCEGIEYAYFFTPFDSYTLLERVPRMHIMCMPCLCRFGTREVNPLDSTFNINAHASECSLTIL